MHFFKRLSDKSRALRKEAAEAGLGAEEVVTEDKPKRPRRRRAEKIDALLQRETSLLGDIVENADNELIEHGRCALHNINVPRRYGIETPGKNRPSHPCSSSA